MSTQRLGQALRGSRPTSITHTQWVKVLDLMGEAVWQTLNPWERTFAEDIHEQRQTTLTAEQAGKLEQIWVARFRDKFYPDGTPKSEKRPQ